VEWSPKSFEFLNIFKEQTTNWHYTSWQTNVILPIFISFGVCRLKSRRQVYTIWYCAHAPVSPKLMSLYAIQITRVENP